MQGRALGRVAKQPTPNSAQLRPKNRLRLGRQTSSQAGPSVTRTHPITAFAANGQTEAMLEALICRHTWQSHCRKACFDARVECAGQLLERCWFWRLHLDSQACRRAKRGAHAACCQRLKASRTADADTLGMQLRRIQPAPPVLPVRGELGDNCPAGVCAASSFR